MLGGRIEFHLERRPYQYLQKFIAYGKHDLHVYRCRSIVAEQTLTVCVAYLTLYIFNIL